MTSNRAMTTRETIHGNPGESRRLPAGALCAIVPADNLPADSDIKYWARPLCEGPASGWPQDTADWAADVGVGLAADDVRLI